MPGEATRRAFSAFLAAFEKGLLIRTTGDIIALSPPLIILRAEIDQIVETLSASSRGSRRPKPKADSRQRRPPLSSFHRKRRVGAAHAAQAGSFSARISTGRMSGCPSSSSSARPSRAEATAP